MGKDVLYPSHLNHKYLLESSAAGEPLPVPGSILRLAGEGALTRNDVSGGGSCRNCDFLLLLAIMPDPTCCSPSFTTTYCMWQVQFRFQGDEGVT